jgi:hypothetical protein
MYVILRTGAAAMMVTSASGFGTGDFVTLAHFVVCVVAAYSATLVSEWARTATTSSWRTKQRRWMWLYGSIALLFNPFLPVSLSRDTWSVFELGIALLLVERVLREVRTNYRVRKRDQTASLNSRKHSHESPTRIEGQKAREEIRLVLGRILRARTAVVGSDGLFDSGTNAG